MQGTLLIPCLRWRGGYTKDDVHRFQPHQTFLFDASRRQRWHRPSISSTGSVIARASSAFSSSFPYFRTLDAKAFHIDAIKEIISHHRQQTPASHRKQSDLIQSYLRRHLSLCSCLTIYRQVFTFDIYIGRWIRRDTLPICDIFPLTSWLTSIS